MGNNELRRQFSTTRLLEEDLKTSNPHDGSVMFVLMKKENIYN